MHKISNIGDFKRVGNVFWKGETHMDQISEKELAALNELLSDCNIDMGMKYLSAYIGILNSNGNVDFNVDDISICQKWQEHLKRIEEESKISSHDGKQIKDNQKENNQQSKNGNDGR